MRPKESFSTAFDEAFRQLAIWLASRVKSGCRRILVTSCWPAEGKTTVVLRLADTLGDLGYSVSLVDLDTRHRRLTHLIRARAETGRPVRLVASAAEAADQSSSLLTSRGFLDVCIRAESQSDIVIYDSLALSVSKDSYWMTERFDGALMVSDVRRLQGLPEANLAESLWENGIELIGVVQTGI